MSPIARPVELDRDNPPIALVLAFMEQVLHLDTASVLDISYETRVPAYPPARKYFSQEYAVTIRLLLPSEYLGDTLYLGVKYDADEYSISQVAFEPGWKPHG